MKKKYKNKILLKALTFRPCTFHMGKDNISCLGYIYIYSIMKGTRLSDFIKNKIFFFQMTEMEVLCNHHLCTVSIGVIGVAVSTNRGQRSYILVQVSGALYSMQFCYKV